MSESYDTIIVGAGAMGAAIGLEMARGDHDAILMPFKLSNLNHSIDCGSFSRLREINQDSSFSVLG